MRWASVALALLTLCAGAAPEPAEWVATQVARDFAAVDEAERVAVVEEALLLLRSAETVADAAALLDLLDRAAVRAVAPAVARELDRLRGEVIGTVLPARRHERSATVLLRLAVLTRRVGGLDHAATMLGPWWRDEARRNGTTRWLDAFLREADGDWEPSVRAWAGAGPALVTRACHGWLFRRGDTSAFGSPRRDEMGWLYRVVAPTSHTLVAWTELDALEVELYWPAEAPRAQILAHVKDWDHHWHQNLLPGWVQPGRTNRIVVPLAPEAKGWEALGHAAAWHLRVLMEPREIGLRVLTTAATDAAPPVLVSARGRSRPEPSAPPTIRDVRPVLTRVPCHERFEVSYRLPDRYPDPFAIEKIHTWAVVTGPDRVTRVVDGFYSVDYYRTAEAAGELALPQGVPLWRLRYTPVTPGPHSFTLHARDPLGATVAGPYSFDALPAQKPGFVRVAARDPRFFEFSDGTPYFPIGHNIRSPTDTRMTHNFPWQFRPEEGSLAYRRFFRDMQAHGENFAEIWSAAWSLGLEWSEGWPGYHGIGQYNLRNAWELDRVLEDAESRGIYLNLVIHNHGKFSGFSDEEWAHNPFNAKLGGYLQRPDDFFTDPRAFADFTSLMRYMVARWGYAPHLFAWQLWSELDLTGLNREGTRPQHRSDVRDWHQRAAQMVRGFDVNDHLISTHVSGDYNNQGLDLIRLPEITHAAVDAYHQSADPLHIVALLQATARHNGPTGKPVLITEFGGSAMASDMAHLDATLHAGLWASTAIPVGGTPMLWWWMAIEEENFYPKFGAVSRFMAGVDRRDPALETVRPGLLLAGGPTEELGVECLRSPSQALGWIYQRASFGRLDPAGEKATRNVELKIPGLDAGRYLVEFWDTLEGRVVATTRVTVRADLLEVQAPAFARDLAFKVRRP